jgi:hypothetical protein
VPIPEGEITNPDDFDTEELVPIPFVPDNIGLLSSTVNLAVFMWRDESAATASVYTTANGTNFTETTFSSLGITGKLVGAVVDPWSPRYISGSGNVNGWVATLDGVWRLTDVDGSAGASQVYDFDVVVDDVIGSVAIHTHIAARNFIVVAFTLTNGSDPSRNGRYVGYTTDGVTWASQKLSIFYGTTPGVPYSDPGWSGICVWVSAHNAGHAFVSDVHDAGNSNTPRVWKTTDFGQNWTVFYDAPDLGGTPHSYFINGWHFPYHDNSDDEEFYITRFSVNGDQEMYQISGGVETAVDSPSTANVNNAGFRENTGMDTYAGDKSILRSICIYGDLPTSDLVQGGYSKSEDGGATWTPTAFGSATTVAKRIAIAGDNLVQTTDDGQNFSDISGDLPGVGAADGDNRILSIWGL